MTAVTINAQRYTPQNLIAKPSKPLRSPKPLRAVSENRPLQGPNAFKVKAGFECPELLSLFRNASFEQHFQPNCTILLHGDSADAMYLVVSGTVRCCTIDDDGSRQIFSFAKKGEFIGISDIEEWHFTAEAVDHVVLRSIPRDIVERHLTTNIALRQEIRSLTCALLQRREKQLLSIISRKAPERLFHFLCDFAASRPVCETGAVALPMCRRDIADHLGLSAETVSRAFTDLKLEGRIELVTSGKFRILRSKDHASTTQSQ